MKIYAEQKINNSLFDPLDIIENEKLENFLLFESADVITKLGEKSHLCFNMALKIECRNNQVIIEALKEEALPMLTYLTNKFLSKIISPTIISIDFLPTFHELDLLKKMQAPSAIDVIREVMKILELENVNLADKLMLTGMFAYDFLDHFEYLPKNKNDLLNCPDYLFYLPLSILTIDHKKLQTTLTDFSFTKNFSHKNILIKNTSNTHKQSKNSNFKFTNDVNNSDFINLINECKKYITNGDVYQIVPSRNFICDIENIFSSYYSLRALNPSPYMFLVKTKEFSLFGSSPETFIKVSGQGKKVSIRPIAGTQIRSENSDLDSRLQAALCLNEKELAEHMMLVDLARNDIACVCKPKSRKIDRLLGIDKFSHVMHLVSEVSGILRDEFDALSAYQASMNMGTLMGAPKVKAASILRNLEINKRGFYGGAIGYLNKEKDFDSAIIIRSAFVKNNKAYIRSGCGVVFDSDPELEMQETINKAKAVLTAIELGGQR